MEHISTRGLEELARQYCHAYPKAYWEQKLETYEAWWEGQLGRPLIYIADYEPERRPKSPVMPYRKFWSYFEPERTIDDRLASLFDHLLHMRCLADGFPHVIPQYGAGVLAQVLGARAVNVSGSVWFEPQETRTITELAEQLVLDPDNSMYGHLLQLYRRAYELCEEGCLQLGMTDIGGAADILSSFRPGSELLLDLYDEPEAVRESLGAIHTAWKGFFELLDAAACGKRPGYSCWTPLLSKRSFYMLQSDFAYSIGPDMFSSFILPELRKMCRHIERPFYHLDGVGQLAHLPQLLEIPELAGIQWIPGEGQKPISQWPEVYRAIERAGKKIQIFMDFDSDPYVLDTIADQIGRADCICAVSNFPYADRDAARSLVKRFS